MSTKKYIKRFCFIPDWAWLDAFTGPTAAEINRMNTLGIASLELYKRDSHVFGILEIDPALNYSGIIKNLSQMVNEAKQMRPLAPVINDKTKLPLERIFKMIPEKKCISLNENSFNRTVMTLELQADKALVNAYKEVHSPENIWPEVIENMHAIGVVDMELYLDAYKVYLIMDTAPGFDMDKDAERWANMPKEKEWQAYVAQFQRVDPNSNAVEKWKIMSKIA